MQFLFTHTTTVLDSDLETPVGMFIRLAKEGQGILFESTEVDGHWGRYSVIATEFIISVMCQDGKIFLEVTDPKLTGLQSLNGLEYLDGLRSLMKAVTIQGNDNFPAITRGLYGYMGYEVAGLLQPKLSKVLSRKDTESCMVLPGSLILFDHVYNTITHLTLTFDGIALKPLSSKNSNLSANSFPVNEYPLVGKESYIDSVKRVTELIRQGEAIQVVVSTPFSAPLKENPFNIYRRLRRANPSAYMFYMHLPNGILLGSSPEVLITCDAGNLKLCPIAGTRPRSDDATEDMMFSEDLLQDPKEKAEHVMLVDLGRNDLGRIAAPGSVKLDKFMEVERFSHVMHLTSYIDAQLAEGKDAIDVLAAGFPAGTVSGAPKVRAMEIIAEEEKIPRGPYAGAIGWIGLDKDSVNLDFGITIRSMWIRDGQIRWQAGAGIVFDSVPEKEWLECRAKSAIIRKVVFGDENSGD